MEGKSTPKRMKDTRLPPATKQRGELTAAPNQPWAERLDVKPKPGRASVLFTSHYTHFMRGDRGGVTLEEAEIEEKRDHPRFRVLAKGEPLPAENRQPNGRRFASHAA